MRPFPAIAVLLLFVAPAGADWPSFHADERNSGAADGYWEAPLHETWRLPGPGPGSAVEGGVVVKGDRLAVGDRSGSVRVLDAATGSTLWSAALTGVTSTPAIDGGRVFVVDTAGTLAAYDLATGTRLGAASVGGTRATPTVHEGKLFIGNEAGEMKAYDTQTLTLLWTFSVQQAHAAGSLTSGGDPAEPDDYTCTDSHPVGQIRAAAAVYRGAVIFGALNNHIYAVNVEGNPDKSTDLLWSYEAADIVWSSATIDHEQGRAIVASYDETVYAFQVSGQTALSASERACGTRILAPTWTFDVPSIHGQSSVHSTPAFDGTRLIFGANNGHVYAIRAGSGSALWTYEAGDDVVSSPATAGGIIAAGADDGKVHLLRATDGRAVGVLDLGAPIKGGPAISGPALYVATMDGTIARFDPPPPPRPDLVIESLEVTADTIRFTVANAGTAPAPASDASLAINGFEVATLHVPSLPVGHSHLLIHAAPVGDDAEVRVVADAFGVVAESDESNNLRLRAAPTPTPSPTPTASGGPEQPLSAAAPLLALIAVAVAVRLRQR